MQVHRGSDPERAGGGFRNAGAVTGVALVAALVPVSAVLALALSSAARRALAARYVPAERVPDVTRWVAFGWMAGFALVMLGQAARAAAGPLSMFDPYGPGGPYVVRGMR